MPGQLALAVETETVVAAAVWETLPPERQLQVALRLARLLARLFFTGILGLAVVGESGRSAYLRGYGDYERVGFKLTDSPEAGLGHAAFRARSADALQACVRRFEAVGGRRGTWIDGDIGHGPAYQFRNPEGHLMEVYFETERQPSASGLPKNRVDRRGRGAIGVRRVDHFNLFSHDVAADRQFAETHLGVRTLDPRRR